MKKKKKKQMPIIKDSKIRREFPGGLMVGELRFCKLHSIAKKKKKEKKKKELIFCLFLFLATLNSFKTTLPGIKLMPSLQ